MIPPAQAVAELLRTPVDALIARATGTAPRRDADGDELGWTDRLEGFEDREPED